jgi:PAS domain S-box-containing protein
LSAKIWQGHIHEDDRQWAIDYCAKATAEKRDHELEYRMIAADSRTVWLRDIVHVVVENNEPVTLRGIMTDITERKRIEQEIINLAKFPAEDPDPVLRIASDGTILYRNEASESLLEFWRCLQDVPVPDIVRTCIEEALNSQKPVYDEVKCCDKIFSLTFAPVGEGGYVNVYARDITERKKVEEALRDSEERFRRISECAFEGIFMHDKGRIVDANKALAVMSGYELSELIGMNGLDLVAPENRELIAKNLQSEFDKPFEVMGLRKDGSTVPLEIQSKRVSFRGQQVIVVAVRDITERKRADELIRTSEANYRAIFESANDAIFIHDIETGKILDFNPRMSDIFGYTRAEAQNFSVDDLSSGKPPYTHKDAVEWIRKAADGTPQVFEWQCRHKSGRLFWAEVSLKRARIGGQNRMLAILRDITERKA